MLQTLKDYWNDFSVLPNPVKGAIYIVLAGLLIFTLYYGANHYIASRKIERLEKQNNELSIKAESALDKAAKAEQNAANEAVRAASLESELNSVSRKAEKQDEKILTQSKKSSDLRNSLTRIRVSSPANRSTDELERRLKARYGQANGNK